MVLLLLCSLLQFVHECKQSVQLNEPRSLTVRTGSLPGCLIDLLSIGNVHSSSRLPLIPQPGEVD